MLCQSGAFRHFNVKTIMRRLICSTDLMVRRANGRWPCYHFQFQKIFVSLKNYKVGGQKVPRISSRILSQVSWVAGSFGLAQLFRLATNVILARLLAPQLFGVMVVVNTLRTGIELLSDIGLGQNIISSRDGDKPQFYNTAWTIQIIRGIVLFLLCAALTGPLAHFYDSSLLYEIMPAICVLFLLTGVQSPSVFLLQKRQAVTRLATYDVIKSAFSAVAHIALAYFYPTIWALVAGLLLSTAFSTASSFFLLDFRSHRLMFDRRHAHEIVKFGKWVFLSSVVFFLAMNFDKLYFAKVVPFALLGIYGIARTFSDLVAMLVQRVGNLLIFPKVANFRDGRDQLRPAIAGLRAKALIGVSTGLSFVVAISDQLIMLLYDQRYHAAAFMLPILMAGTWFSILATMGEAFMLGIGRSIHTARSNLVKLFWLVISVPLAITYLDFTATLCAIALGDLPRYLSLAFSQRAEKLSFLKQDIVFTTIFLMLILVWRLILVQLGLATDFTAWLSLGNAAIA